MQLQQLDVEDLFGRLRQSIEFPTRREEEGADASPAVVILHGPNGVGKTTALRMLVGFMELDFDVFRQIPFGKASLTFSTGEVIGARRLRYEDRVAIEVTFEGETVLLAGLPGQKGGLDEEAQGQVQDFRQRFFTSTRGIRVDFISTERRPVARHSGDDGYVTEAGRLVQRPGRRREPDRSLAKRVQDFVQEAQVNYRRFFTSAEPDLLSRLIDRSEREEQEEKVDRREILRRLESVWGADERRQVYGIERDNWNIDDLRRLLAPGRGRRSPRGETLTVIAAYTEVLESRAKERELIADRLATFEHLADEFFLAKRVRVQAHDGFTIEDTVSGARLEEEHLSSGEYHLLYLLVSSLVTQRRGTVIAIDEPEMSMHIAWQRRLISALLQLASNATPQFVFATHSPDIVANYADFLVPLEG
jgi:ABC-type hemin transport system ATPase subunit